MTDKVLKYYTALQPLFREKMGSWQVGDCYVSPTSGLKGWVSIDYINRFNNTLTYKNYLRLPLTIDDVNPERGLWGMIKEGFPSLSQVYDSSIVTIQDDSFEGSTPTLALLKALCYQEGITP